MAVTVNKTWLGLCNSTLSQKASVSWTAQSLVYLCVTLQSQGNWTLRISGVNTLASCVDQLSGIEWNCITTAEYHRHDRPKYMKVVCRLYSKGIKLHRTKWKLHITRRNLKERLRLKRKMVPNILGPFFYRASTLILAIFFAYFFIFGHLWLSFSEKK